MKLYKSKNSEVNYLAKIVDIQVFQPHPNPEVTRLKCCTVNGFNIICGIDCKPGVYVYFPAMCQINPQFLAYANQFKHSELNAHPEQPGGMFEDNGRVKAIRLKGCISEGFILPIVYLTNFISDSTNKELIYNIGDEFDSVKEGDKEFWINKKYIVEVQESYHVHNSKQPKQPKGIDKLIPDQFRYHYDTILVKKCPQVIQPDNWIHISTKVNGTSGISARVLCNGDATDAELLFVKFYNNLISPVLGWLGIDSHMSITPKYDYLYSSRHVIKNQYYNRNVGPGFYGCDVWEYADKIVRPHLDKGMTAYYEIIGYLPNGNFIQKNYDYGYVRPSADEVYEYGKHFGIRIYRVTLTNVDGVVHEFSPREVQIWANNNNLIPVTELYYGKAGDLYPDINHDLNWSDNFITALSNDSKRFYMECSSPDCTNNVPHEGVVIKNDNMRSEAFKLKCFKFLDKEQEALDKGQSNIEDNA